MKGIIAVLLTAFVVGCSTTQTPSEPVATQPMINEPIPVTVTSNPEPIIIKQKSTDARIDATAFLQALIDSGCVIDKAEYKEVARGGGISVECADDTDILESPGLGDL